MRPVTEFVASLRGASLLRQAVKLALWEWRKAVMPALQLTNHAPYDAGGHPTGPPNVLQQAKVTASHAGAAPGDR